MTYRIAVVTAGLREPSSTKMLADRLGEAALSEVIARGELAELDVVDLRTIAAPLTSALMSGEQSTEVAAATSAVSTADAVIAVSPIFSGSYNGLFKTFFDLLDDGVLAGTPVLLGATAGTPRHSLAIEHAMRPLFAYLRALVVPTGVFAATDDFGRAGAKPADDVAPLDQRVSRAGAELAELVLVRGRKEIKDEFTDFTPFDELLGHT